MVQGLIPRRGNTVLTALVALVMLLSGSLSGAAQSATPAGTPVGSGYTPFRFEETQTVTLLTAVQSQEAGPPGGDWEWPALVRDQLNIDVKVEWVTDPFQYTQTLRTRASANELPDVFQSDLTTTALIANQGLAGDWGPLLQYMPTYVRDRNVQALAPIGTLDGKQVALVIKNGTPIKSVVAIRQDWLDALGLPVPKTTEEFLAVAKAFTEQDPDGNGQADTWGFTGSVNSDGLIVGLEGFRGAFGDNGPWEAGDGTLVNRAATEGHRQYLEFVSQVAAAGVMDPDWASQESLDSASKWKSGRIGILFNDWCAVFCVQGYSEFKGANPNGSLAIIDPPVGPGGASLAGEYSQAGSQYGVSQTAIDDGRGEAVARLMEWINGPGYVPTAFGKEGVTFDLDADGNRVQQTDVATIPYRQMVSWGYVGSQEELRTRYGNVTTYPDGEVIDVFKVLERCGQYNVSDITQWAAMPPPPAGTFADFIRTQAEAEYAFMTGQRSFEEWDAYIESLNSVGLEEWTTLATEKARELGIIQ